MIKAGKRSRTWEEEAEDDDEDGGAAAQPGTGTDSFIKTVLEEEEQAKQAGKSRPGASSLAACCAPFRLVSRAASRPVNCVCQCLAACTCRRRSADSVRAIAGKKGTCHQ